MLTLKPGWRQLMAESFWWIALFCGVAASSLYLDNRLGFYANLAMMGTATAAFLLVLAKYIVLRNIRWVVDDETLCRQKGVLARQKDYIELYRVVDYVETQTFLQRMFGVKTVIILSMDRTDAEMEIFGVQVWMDIVGHIRYRVEQCKKAKRIYEITNN